jgi:hypothetical protein
VATVRALDLTRAPFAERLDAWTNPTDYRACQELAAAAREAGIALLRSVSARDPSGGCNTVVFDPAVFSAAEPTIRRTWHLRFEQGRLSALAAFPGEDRFIFTATGFGLA